jgi:hypothetical protein
LKLLLTRLADWLRSGSEGEKSMTTPDFGLSKLGECWHYLLRQRTQREKQQIWRGGFQEFSFVHIIFEMPTTGPRKHAIKAICIYKPGIYGRM